MTFAASGLARTTFSYQWQFNGTNLLNATNATLTLPNVQTGNQGTYRVVLSNGAGATYSQEVSLGLGLPVIASATQPLEQTILFGSDLTLNVVASNQVGCTLPIGHTWFFNGLAFSASTNYTILSAANASAGVYSNVVDNGAHSTNISWTVHVAGEGMPIWWGNITQAWDWGFRLSPRLPNPWNKRFFLGAT